MLNKSSSCYKNSELGDLLGSDLGIGFDQSFLARFLVVEFTLVGLGVLVGGTEILAAPALDAQKPGFPSAFGTALRRKLEVGAARDHRSSEGGFWALCGAGCGGERTGRIDVVLLLSLHIA